MVFVTERRSVHPVITQAIVDGLDRAELRPVLLDEARRTLAGGNPVEERVHRSLKKFLFEHGGAWASFDAGHQFSATTNHPIIDVLSLSRSPSQLLHRIRRLEPLLHLGNRTVITASEQKIRVTHAGNRGETPTVGESLFVCGAQCGMLTRIGARTVRADTSLAGNATLRVWPKQARSPWPEKSPAVLDEWTISWSSAPSIAPVLVSGDLGDDIRTRVGDQPEQPWTVAIVAEAFALSPRSLQRTLSRQGNELRKVVLEGRLDAAQALLTRTNVPISIIAYLCGFADAAHLANVARSLLGCTPSAIREQSTYGPPPSAHLA
jgi:AraC-like DNA-binding protein